MTDKTEKAGVEQGTAAGVQPLLDAEASRPSAAENIEASRRVQEEEREALRTPAGIAPAPASAIESSGAIMEPSVKKAVDVDHPAVDNNPRALTTEAQNRIDFNDPTQNDRDAVAERLSNQG